MRIRLIKQKLGFHASGSDSVENVEKIVENYKYLRQWEVAMLYIARQAGL